MRIAATLLVLLVFGGLGWRLAQRPSRAYERERIVAQLDLAATDKVHREGLLARLDRFDADYGGDPESRWFTAEMRLGLGQAGSAIEGIWEDPTLAAAPDTPRRLGALLARSIGFEQPGELGHPTGLAESAALLLMEGGDAEARAWLQERTTASSIAGLFSSFYGTFLYAGSDTRQVVADWLGSREEPEARTTAALLRVGPVEYPKRAGDLAALEKVVDSSLRWQERFVWSTACVALGTSEDPRSIAVLAELRGRLSEMQGPQDAEDVVTLAAGELAAGRWDALSAFTPSGPGTRTTQSRVWFGDAIVHRLVTGDAQAAPTFERLWDGFRRVPDPPLVARLATAVLLKDAFPPPAVDADTVLELLERADATPEERAVALAFRTRRGDPEAVDRVVAMLVERAAAGWVSAEHAAQDRILVSPILTLCRALLLYGTP